VILYVRYRDGKCDYVNALFIEGLIRDQEISMFYRPSERQWIDVDSGRIRRGTRERYDGAERRSLTSLAR
jgi:hypothetical protein